jgi:hypothetical protein
MISDTLKGLPLYHVIQRVGQNGLMRRTLGKCIAQADAIKLASNANLAAAQGLGMDYAEYLDYLDKAEIVEGRVEVVMARI